MHNGERFKRSPFASSTSSLTSSLLFDYLLLPPHPSGCILLPYPTVVKNCKKCLNVCLRPNSQLIFYSGLEKVAALRVQNISLFCCKMRLFEWFSNTVFLYRIEEKKLEKMSNITRLPFINSRGSSLRSIPVYIKNGVMPRLSFLKLEWTT